ncbi:MAG: hypothetical protein KTR28_01995 [Micavibrio sp.]|nr:hypothetical protein [Micavibrio sp.]
MKFNFDIECTPEEARRFMGLPDVTPLHDVVMDEMQKNILDGMRKMQPEQIMNTWFPTSMQSFTDIQRMFWSQMGVKFPEDDEKPSKKK